MEFTFETRYNPKTMALMARALRKTIRKRHSCRSHIAGWAVVALGLLLATRDGLTWDFRTVVTLAAVALVVAALLFEDRLNGYVAARRLAPGTEKAMALFTEEGFVSTTDLGRSEWKYDKILTVAETGDFFVFIFSASHAQLYDKRQMRGGTPEEFRRFLEERTGKGVQQVR